MYFLEQLRLLNSRYFAMTPTSPNRLLKVINNPWISCANTVRPRSPFDNVLTFQWHYIREEFILTDICLWQLCDIVFQITGRLDILNRNSPLTEQTTKQLSWAFCSMGRLVIGSNVQSGCVHEVNRIQWISTPLVMGWSWAATRNDRQPGSESQHHVPAGDCCPFLSPFTCNKLDNC